MTMAERPANEAARNNNSYFPEIPENVDSPDIPHHEESPHLNIPTNQRTNSSSNDQRPPANENRSYATQRSRISNYPRPGTYYIRNRSHQSTMNNSINTRGTPEKAPVMANPADYVYVADGYRDLNPQYQTQKDTPIWGLGRPLPRVVRPGMRRDETKPQNEPSRESGKGGEEQVGDRPSHSQPQQQQYCGGESAHNLGQGPRGEPAVWAEENSRQRDKEPAVQDQRTPVWIPGESKEYDYEDATGNFQQEYVPQGEVHEYLNTWCKWRDRVREPLAEWLATMVVVFIGACGNLQVTTSQGAKGNYLQEAWAWGIGVMLGIYIAGGVSGAHLNPMISIVLSVFRGFPVKRCLVYSAAQFIGAMCGCALAYGVYKDAIHHYDPAMTIDNSGVAFIMMPPSFVTLTTAFFNEFAASAVLTGTLLALGDDSNAPPGAGMNAFIVGLDVAMLMMTFGSNSGPSLSPARDLAGRLIGLWVGYGTDVWSRGWWALSWTGSIFGGLMGCAMYDLVIFMGGESPINYPKSERRRKYFEGKKRMFWCFGMRQKARDIEQGLRSDKESGTADNSSNSTGTISTPPTAARPS